MRDVAHRGDVRDPAVEELVDVAAELHHRVDALRHRLGVEAPEQGGAHVRHVVGVGDERRRSGFR